MPSFEQIINDINAVLQLIFGKNIPSWILPLVGWILLSGLLLWGLWGLLFGLSKIKDIWSQNFWPLFYSREEKQRSIHRRYFAEHIESEIIRLGRQEDWKDYRFTELEAEVEAEGQRRIFSPIPFLNRTDNSLRREKSLSIALKTSRERLILVEGEPGAGKSIALRHVAQTLAAQAKRKRSTKSTIPIYVNLKELEHKDGVPIDRNLIEVFVLQSLKRIKDRDVDKFLEDEFKVGIENGSWFFLFDSFDELPEVLSSTEADEIIRSYGNAIDDFLHGMNQCRGIVASRQFHGPNYFDWPCFLVLSLSKARRLQLIRKANLKREIETDLIGQIDTANDEIRLMTRNPLLLNLLCEHIKSGYHFPINTYTVFETYVESRLSRDKQRLQQLFKLDSTEIRTVAEKIAFSMAADSSLGLSPTRENLKKAIFRLNMKVDGNFEAILDALEFLKLARTEVATETNPSNTFTFAHRRFQEYFATCVVLREPSRVVPVQLLTDAHWRETAVVMFQTQPISVLKPILDQADILLAQFCKDFDPLMEIVFNPKQHVVDQVQLMLEYFPWPPGSLHLLSLLQEGFANRLIDLPDRLRIHVGRIVQLASEVGILPDRRCALNVSGIAPELVLAAMLKEAFSSDSQWLKDVAYRQVAHLSNITPEIAQGIRNAILKLANTGRLSREEHATKAHLKRMNRSENFLSIMQLLLWMPKIDFWLHCAFLTVCLWTFFQTGLLKIEVVLGLSLLSLFSYVGFHLGRDPSEPLFLPISLCTRLSLIFFPFLAFLAGRLNGSSISSIERNITLATSCLFYFGFLIAPFSILAAKSGLFAHRRWWIFLPLWPILYLFTHPYSIVIFISKKLLGIKRSSVWLPILTFVVGGGILSITLSWWIIYLEKYPSIWGDIVTYIVFGIMFLAMIYVFSAIIYLIVQDQSRWHKWFHRHKGLITCQEFGEATSYRSPAYVRRALKEIRIQQKLAATIESELFIRGIAFRIENRQRKVKAKIGASISLKEAKKNVFISLPESTKVENIASCRKLMLSDDAEVLDEIYMLLEDIHNAK